MWDLGSNFQVSQERLFQSSKSSGFQTRAVVVHARFAQVIGFHLPDSKNNFTTSTVHLWEIYYYDQNARL